MSSVFLAIGPEKFLLKEFIQQYKKAATAKYGEFSVQTLSVLDNSMGEIKNEVLSPAFFGGKRVIFLENFPPAATPKLSEKKKAEYLSFLSDIDNIADDVVLFCISPTPDKRTKFFKTLQKNAEKVYDHPILDPKKDSAKITAWISERGSMNGVNIDIKTAEFLRSFSGNHFAVLNSEIEKLALYKPGENITSEHIIALCVPSDESADFAFSNAVSGGKANKILSEVSSLVDQFDAAMVWNRDILSTLRTLLKVRFSLDSPGESSGLHPFVLRNMKRVVSTLSTQQLTSFHKLCTEIDAKTKNGQLSLSGDSRGFVLAVEKILYQLFQK